MRVADRLRRLDERVLGVPEVDHAVPWWARVGAASPGMLIYLLSVAVRDGGRWWVVATVYAAVTLPLFVLGLRHWRRGRVASVAVFVLGGAAIVVASALAPKPGEQSSYARGCHPAPRDVAQRIQQAVAGDFRLGRIVVYGGRHAAVASALVSGTLPVGDVSVPLDPTPVDWSLTPGPPGAMNQLAGDVTPSLRGLLVDRGADVDDVRLAAERCAAGQSP